jgi:hypothetical protein
MGKLFGDGEAFRFIIYDLLFTECFILFSLGDIIQDFGLDVKENFGLATEGTENAEILSFFINRGLARIPAFAGTGLHGFDG